MVNLETKVEEIEIVSIKSLREQNFFQRYKKPGKPVIIKDLLEPDTHWDLSFLCEKIGQNIFPIRCYGNQKKQDRRQWKSVGSGTQARYMSFNEYAKCIRTREAHTNDLYLAKCPIGNTSLQDSSVITQLKTHLEQKLQFHRPVSDFNIWVGPAGHTESLHYDGMDGTLLQLHGSKQISLFPPHQLDNLYPFPIRSHLKYGMRLRCWFSQVTINQPDFEVFPKFKEALRHRRTLTLNPGELLFIPTGWWHEVTALGSETDMVCSMNRFWFVSPFTRVLSSWQWWRTHIGSVSATPHTLAKLGQSFWNRDQQHSLVDLKRLF